MMAAPYLEMQIARMTTIAETTRMTMVMKVDKIGEACSPGGRNHTDDEDEKGEEGGEKERGMADDCTTTAMLARLDPKLLASYT